MIVVIDNYDSFTFNLVHYLSEIERDIVVLRNDELNADEVLAMEPSRIIISPGPCTPKEAGISIELVKKTQSPLLGVCLGHQSIGAAFGAEIIKAPSLFHGKKSRVKHNNSSLYKGIDREFEVVRYHSLIIDKATLPSELEVNCTLADDPNIIMGIAHKFLPIFGVQFHPESIESSFGKKILRNFMEIS
ncbi:MAG: aminodeoxychorismate/anthranilate synthase component II [Gammaproteobacteria bacterium]